VSSAPTNPPPPSVPSLDERQFQQESVAKTRELDLREREVAAREREVSQWWRNPIIVALGVAFIGFLANLGVAFLNNRSTLEVEHHRLQSNLVLEAIKTGKTDTACQNLLFFVGLRLLDDTNKTISNRCETAPKGAPSLPAVPASGGYGLQPFGQSPFGSSYLRGSVYDPDSGSFVAGAKVIVNQSPDGETDTFGSFPIPGLPQGAAPDTEIDVTVEKEGYERSSVKLKANGLLVVYLRRKKPF